MVNMAKVSKYFVALLAANGFLWVIAGAIFGGTVALAFSIE